MKIGIQKVFGSQTIENWNTKKNEIKYIKGTTILEKHHESVEKLKSNLVMIARKRIQRKTSLKKDEEV